MILGQCRWPDENGRCERQIKTFREPPGKFRLYPVCDLHAKIIDGGDEEVRTTSEDVPS